MQLIRFNLYDDMDTKKEKAMEVFNKLRTLERVEASALCPASAMEMAKLLVQLDSKRVIAMIEVHGFFLRIYRADLDGFRFGAVINDVRGRISGSQND